MIKKTRYKKRIGLEIREGTSLKLDTIKYNTEQRYFLDSVKETEYCKIEHVTCLECILLL